MGTAIVIVIIVVICVFAITATAIRCGTAADAAGPTRLQRRK